MLKSALTRPLPVKRRSSSLRRSGCPIAPIAATAAMSIASFIPTSPRPPQLRPECNPAYHGSRSLPGTGRSPKSDVRVARRGVTSRLRDITFNEVEGRAPVVRSKYIAAVFAALLTLPALAQAPPEGTPTRIRGTGEKLAGQTVTVKSREGDAVPVAVAPGC